MLNKELTSYKNVTSAFLIKFLKGKNRLLKTNYKIYFHIILLANFLWMKIRQIISVNFKGTRNGKH